MLIRTHSGHDRVRYRYLFLALVIVTIMASACRSHQLAALDSETPSTTSQAQIDSLLPDENKVAYWLEQRTPQSFHALMYFLESADEPSATLAAQIEAELNSWPDSARSFPPRWLEVESPSDGAIRLARYIETLDFARVKREAAYEDILRLLRWMQKAFPDLSVKHLDLSDNNLRGEQVVSLVQKHELNDSLLKDLRSVDLANNRIDDQGMCHMVNSRTFAMLEEIGLAFNGISRNGISCVAADENYWKNVRRLDLSWNRRLRFRDVVDLSLEEGFPQLRALSLRGNRIFHRELEALTQTDVQMNSRLRHLREIDLSSTQLNDSAIQLLTRSFLFSHINVLRISDNPISSSSVSNLFRHDRMSSLRILELNSTNIDSDVLEFIAKSSKLLELEELHVRNTKVGDEGLEAIAASPNVVNLRYIDVSWTNVSGYGLSLLLDEKSEPSIQRLSASDNCFTYGDVMELSGIGHNDDLKYLNLGRNNFGDRGAIMFGGPDGPEWRALKFLSIARVNLGDEGFEALARSPNFRKLRQLNVSGNRIGKQGVQNLVEGGFPLLVSIDLSNNLVDTSAIHLISTSDLPARLFEMDLRRNPIDLERREVRELFDSQAAETEFSFFPIRTETEVEEESEISSLEYRASSGRLCL